MQRSKAIGFCYINSTMFFFMYANLNKSPAYGMSTELTMPTYNKFQCLVETQKKLCESGKDPAVVTKISVSEGL